MCATPRKIVFDDKEPKIHNRRLLLNKNIKFKMTQLRSIYKLNLIVKGIFKKVLWKNNSHPSMVKIVQVFKYDQSKEMKKRNVTKM